MPDSSTPIAVDPEQLAAAARSACAAATLVAGWDLAADLGPIVVALPGTASATVAVVLGQTWADRLSGVHAAALAESERLATAAGSYAGVEEVVSAQYDGRGFPASTFSCGSVQGPDPSWSRG